MYKAFETTPNLEFEFFLATKLGKTVGELREQMSQAEFGAWSIYYQRQAQQRELDAKTGGRK